MGSKTGVRLPVPSCPASDKLATAGSAVIREVSGGGRMVKYELSYVDDFVLMANMREQLMAKLST